jgi:type I restriction enzyme S subunit
VISAKVVKEGRILRPIQQQISPDFYSIWMTRGYPKPGDVVLTTEGPLGEVAQLDSESCHFALGQRIVVLRGREKRLDNNFLKFLLMSPRQQEILASYATGTTVAGVSQKSLRSMPVELPSYEDQVAIGTLLAALNDKVDLNRRMNETLDAMARALFKDWFVDFGPTRAKVEGRPAYLATSLWDMFPDTLDEGGKPSGWKDGTLADVADLNPESWARATYPTEIRYVDLSNTKWGTVESTEGHDKESAPSRAQRILRRGDTIVGTVRPGNGSYALIGEEGLTGSTGFAVLRPKDTSYQELTYLAATSFDNIQRLAHLADGAAYPAVRPEAVMATTLRGFNENVVQRFSGVVSPLMEQIETNKLESRVLAEAGQLLLPKLMSGEVRLKCGEPTA